MQWKMTFSRRSEDEDIKDNGMTLDLDEMARKGVSSKEEKSLLKWYGIYSSRQPGTHMARVVIPGGVVTSSQARNIAEASEKYAQGRVNATTRQALQLHWLKIPIFADMIRDLRKEGNSTKHGCGDVARNVATCELAQNCKYRRLNAMKYARQAARYLTDAKDLNNLPRKFKMNFSGCKANCAQPYMNCLGANGVLIKDGDTEKAGFQVVIGGGMGWKPFVAQELFTFVPEEKIVDMSRAVALLFREHGDRFNRAKSRLKFVVFRKGIDFCREVVMDFLKKEGIDTTGILTEPVEDIGVPIDMKRPLIVEDPVGTDGKATVRMMIPKGEIGFRDLEKIAELADVYADQKVYMTNRQNIVLHGVDPDKIDAVKAEIKESLGYETEGFFGLKDIVSCVGTTYCPKAVSRTRDLFDLLQPLVRKDKYKDIEKHALINITGCPNSCSPYRIVDIGFRGMRIREELGSVEGYEMLIGGDQQDHGKKLGEFKVADCPEIVETILDEFIKVRQPDETLTECVNRLGLDYFKEVVFA